MMKLVLPLVSALVLSGCAVAQLEPESLGELGVERHERRPGIARLPPFAFDYGRGARHRRDGCLAR